MAIYGPITEAEASLIPPPRHVWINGSAWWVFTGSDIPVEIPDVEPENPLLDIVTPEQFYSAADGGDWLPSILRAQDAAKEIRFQPGKTYAISEAIKNVSNRRWRGHSTTLIYNEQTHSNVPKRSGWMLGNIHPAMFKYSAPSAGHLPSYDIAPVLAGSAVVELSTPAHAVNFAVGQFVAVRHTTEVFDYDSYYPLYVHFAKVRGISDGVLLLDRPVLDAIPTACICPIGGTIDPFMGYAWNFVEGVEIEGFAVSARSIISTRPGAYRCKIANVEGRDTDFLIAVNAFVESEVSKVWGTPKRRALEVKCYSQDSEFRDFRATMLPTMDAVPFDIGEQANRNRFRNIRITVPSDVTAAQAAYKNNGFKNTVEDSEIAHLGSYSGECVATLRGSIFAGYSPNGNRHKNVRLISSASRTHHIIVGTAGAVANPDGYTLDGVECIGATSSGRSLKVAAGGGQGCLIGGEYPYPHEISTGATPPSESGVSIGGVVGSSVLSGTATPEGAVNAKTGSVYVRRGTNDAYPAYIKTTDTGVNGWVRLRTVGGCTQRDDVDITMSLVHTEIQEWATALTSDRYATLPTVSSADGGRGHTLIKSSSAGAGKLGVKDPSGTILGEIAATKLGMIFCWWRGTSWGCRVVEAVA